MMIRPYEPKDHDAVEFVCLNSEGPCDLNETGQFYILTTYCDYFIEKEPQNCFVAVNDADEAVGYIICAENYDRFLPVFLAEYVSRFSPDDLYRRRSAEDSTLLQKKHKSEYPAHLHIDLLPEYQRQGLGSRLVDTLADHLRKKGVSGVMLTVGASNDVGRSFYTKYGFTRIDALPDDVAYGLRLL